MSLGLIEADTTAYPMLTFRRFTEAMSLGLIEAYTPSSQLVKSVGFSEAMSLGLIEACRGLLWWMGGCRVFRGDEPRPH